MNYKVLIELYILTNHSDVTLHSIDMAAGIRKMQLFCAQNKFALRHLQTGPNKLVFNLKRSDKKEVEHHSKLANSWWDIPGPVPGLHTLNEIRVPFICDGLIGQGKILPNLQHKQNILSNQNILEIGCGGGILSENLARVGAKVTALDLSEDMIAIAQKHITKDPDLAMANRIHYKVESIEEHAITIKNYYDAIVISEVLEHIDDKVEFLASGVETLKPGGSVFITTLNKTLTMWLVGVVFGEYIYRAIPIGTHHYGKMISPEDVESILKKLNCDTVLIRGSSYNFFRNTWRWTDSTSMFYALHAVKK